MMMDLDAWLTSALDAQDKGLALPNEYGNKSPTIPTANKLKPTSSSDEEPEPKRGKGVITGQSSQQRLPNAADARRKAARGQRRRDNPSLSPVDASYVLSDDESVDEGLMDGIENDSRHPLDALLEDLALKDIVVEEKKLAKGKKKGRKGKKKVKGDKAEEYSKFAGITACEHRRLLQYAESLRLGRRREMIPMMATAVRRPPESTDGGMKYEYRFLGSKLDLLDGLSGNPQATGLLGTKAQQGSPATKLRRQRAWMKKLVEEMSAAVVPPDEHQQEAAEEQSMPSESTRGRCPSRNGTCAEGKWSGRDPSRERQAKCSKRRRHCRISITKSSSSPLSGVGTPSDDGPRFPGNDVFSDEEADLNPSLSSSDSDSSREGARGSAPTWDAFERYPEILDPENWQKEEEPMASDAEAAFEQFKHDFEKYKAKDSVGAPFWEELRRSLPSFGFDRAREEKFFVGYDEDGREVRYTDERFMERRIRESQVLEYQAECRRLLEEQEQYVKEQEQQTKEQEQLEQLVGAAERKDTCEERKQRREQVSCVGEKKNVWWQAGFRGVGVELKKVSLKDDQVVCVVGNKVQRGAKRRDEESVTPQPGKGRKAKVMKCQGEVHKEVVALAKKLRLARRRQRDCEKERHFGGGDDRGGWEEGCGGDLACGGPDCGAELNNEHVGNLGKGSCGDDFKDSLGDDNFEEGLKEWNFDESGDAATNDAKKERGFQNDEELEIDVKFLSDDETHRTHTLDEEVCDDNHEDNDVDSLMAILKTDPWVEPVRKTKERTHKKKDNLDRARYLHEMKEKKRKMQQVEEERCRQVIFSQSLEFQEQEEERMRQERRARMLRDLEKVDTELDLFLEDLEKHDPSDDKEHT